MRHVRRWTASGPALDGCHEIPADVAAEFTRRGGQDIQVWGSDYIVDADTQEAADFAAAALSLENVEEGESVCLHGIRSGENCITCQAATS